MESNFYNLYSYCFYCGEDNALDTKKNSEIKEVVGLKGMAALIVMLSHYVIAFFPAVWNAEYHNAHVLVVEKLIHRTPLYFFFNGSQMVSLFWCISGFLIGYAWFKSKDICMLKKRILGRYFKLVIPIFVSMILAYILHLNNLFFNSYASNYTWSEWLAGFYQWDVLLSLSIIDGLFGVFFIGSCEYNPILWTMKAEVFGIVFASFFLLFFCGDEKSKGRNYAYCFFVILVNIFYQPLFAFLIGIFIADVSRKKEKIVEQKCVVILFVALVMGSFLPIWKFIPVDIVLTTDIVISIGEIFRSLAAGLLLTCALNSNMLSKLLTTKFCCFFGNISMYLYIYHFIIMCSFSCRLFLILVEHLENNYVLCAIISILVGIGETVLVSCLLKKVLDRLTDKLLKRVYGLL